ncbi:MAG: hypothetical protein ABIP01_06705 [Candidatus Limnocylindria bacterium]
MATPKPGEIRCPTCHRSTAPAAFCTQCGSAIPPDARIRPRGMDRDELQDRIRARRSGGEPYRRGGSADEDRGGYERFAPDPDDAHARRAQQSDDRRRDYLDEGAAAGAGAAAAAGGAAGGGAAADVTRDRDEWSRPASAPTPAGAPPSPDYGPPPSDVPLDNDPLHVDNYDDAAYDDAAYPYEYDEWEESRDRRSGAGAFAILGFLALGVLALLGGAVLAGIFNTDPNTGLGDSSPTPSATIAASLDASVGASPSTEATPPLSGSPGASGEPVVFPDGFTVETQPCIPGSAGVDGCDSNAVSNSGSVWVWVGFKNGTENDVIGVTLLLPDGSTEDGSIPLAQIGCSPTCPGGWTYFPFGGLQPGTYEVEVTRNGEPADSTTFEVT